jgi:hypothetical protein
MMAHGASNIAFASSIDPRMEGFQATVILDGKPYGMRVAVPIKEKQNEEIQDQENRRVWRVLYHHMKAVFEAADSGVIDIRELLLPFLVTTDGRTMGQRILQDLPKAIAAPQKSFLEAR